MADLRIWSLFVFAILGIPLLTALPARHVRIKRQSQMDPLLRAVCEGKNNGSYAHPYSCGSYITCFNENYQEQDCPGNMVFNSKKKTCDFRYLTRCKTVDGLIESEEESKKFGPEIPVVVDHPPLTRQTS